MHNRGLDGLINQIVQSFLFLLSKTPAKKRGCAFTGKGRRFDRVQPLSNSGRVSPRP